MILTAPFIGEEESNEPDYYEYEDQLKQKKSKQEIYLLRLYYKMSNLSSNHQILMVLDFLPILVYSDISLLILPGNDQSTRISTVLAFIIGGLITAIRRSISIAAAHWEYFSRTAELDLPDSSIFQ